MDVQTIRNLTTAIQTNLRLRLPAQPENKRRRFPPDRLTFAVEKVYLLQTALEVNNTTAFLNSVDHLHRTGFNFKDCFPEEDEKRSETESAWKELVEKTRPWI